jgi:hypothetical protein
MSDAASCSIMPALRPGLWFTSSSKPLIMDSTAP